MMNLSCNVNVKSANDLYILNHPCNYSRFINSVIKYPTSTYSYIFLAVASIIFALTIIFGYNSVRVIKHKLYVPILSNSIWVVYFIVSGIKSSVLAVTYGRKYGHDAGYQLTNWIFGTFELFLFCLALSYQKKFRCSDEDRISIDLENESNVMKKFCERLKIADYVSGIVAVFTILSVILFASVNGHILRWFWIYVALTSFLVLMCLAFAIAIASKKGYRKPALITKFCFIFGVLLTAPERIPIFIWQYCVYGNKNHCWGSYYDLFDLFLLLKLISIFLIFGALIKEFNRFKERAQFSILKEVHNLEGATSNVDV